VNHCSGPRPAEDRIGARCRSLQSSATSTSYCHWVMQMVAFRGGLAAPPPPPSQVGQWSRPFAWPIDLSAYALLPTGRVACVRWPKLRAMTHGSGTLLRTFFPPCFADQLFCNGAAALLMGGFWSPADIFGPRRAQYHQPLRPVLSDMVEWFGHGFSRWYHGDSTSRWRMLVTGGELDCDGVRAVIRKCTARHNSWTSLSGASSVFHTNPICLLPDGRVLNTAPQGHPYRQGQLTIPTQTWTMVDASTPDEGERGHVSSGNVSEDRNVGRSRHRY